MSDAIISDQIARNLAHDIAAGLREHIAVCTANERAFRDWQLSLGRTIDRIEGDIGKSRDELRVMVKEMREDMETKVVEQRDINLKAGDRATSSEARINAWRSDQAILRISVALNGALFTALVLETLKLAGKF